MRTTLEEFDKEVRAAIFGVWSRVPDLSHSAMLVWTEGDDQLHGAFSDLETAASSVERLPGLTETARECVREAIAAKSYLNTRSVRVVFLGPDGIEWLCYEECENGIGLS